MMRVCFIVAKILLRSATATVFVGEGDFVRYPRRTEIFIIRKIFSHSRLIGHRLSDFVKDTRGYN